MCSVSLTYILLLFGEWFKNLSTLYLLYFFLFKTLATTQNSKEKRRNKMQVSACSDKFPTQCVRAIYAV